MLEAYQADFKLDIAELVILELLSRRITHFRAAKEYRSKWLLIQIWSLSAIVDVIAFVAAVDSC